MQLHGWPFTPEADRPVVAVLSLGSFQRLRLRCAACADDTNEYDYSEVCRLPGAHVQLWMLCLPDFAHDALSQFFAQGAVSPAPGPGRARLSAACAHRTTTLS